MIVDNTMVTNTINSDNSNIAYIKIQHHQIMATIAYRSLKFEKMIKKQIGTNYTFFTAITFSNISSA